MGKAFDFCIRHGQWNSTTDAITYSILPNPLSSDLNKSIEIKAGTVTFKCNADSTFAAVAGRQFFKTNDVIQIYAKQEGKMDKSGDGSSLSATDLLFAGTIDNVDLNRAVDKRYWEIDAVDKTKTLYNYIWNYAYAATADWRIWNESDESKGIIKNIVDRINLDYSFDGPASSPKRPFTYNNVARHKSDGSAFPAINLSGLNQPAGKWFDTMASQTYTEDGNYVFWVDNDNDIHFEQKSGVTDLTLDFDAPSINIYQFKLTYSVIDSINYIIFDAGKDKNEYSIYGYVLSADNDGVLRPKFVSDTDTAKKILLANPAIDNAVLRTQARTESKARMQKVVDAGGNPLWNGMLEIDGTLQYATNKLLHLTDSYPGISLLDLRIKTINHNFSENGWFTQLEFAEDEATMGIV